MSEWHGPRCDMLLGKDTDDGDWIEVRYKTAKYRIQGVVIATCRRCGEDDSRETRHADTCECVECDNDRGIAEEARKNMEKPA